MNTPWTIEEHVTALANHATRTFSEYTSLHIKDSRGRIVATLSAPDIDSTYSLSLAECREAARAMVGAVNAEVAA